MAQHFQTRYIDDLDGTDLGETANTLSFGFDGKDYSIDLSDENAETFRQVIAPYIEAGRRVTGTRTRTRTRTTRARSTSGNTKAVREWARANGYDVSDRGRIPPTSWTPIPATTSHAAALRHQPCSNRCMIKPHLHSALSDGTTAGRSVHHWVISRVHSPGP